MINLFLHVNYFVMFKLKTVVLKSLKMRVYFILNIAILLDTGQFKFNNNKILKILTTSSLQGLF